MTLAQEFLQAYEEASAAMEKAGSNYLRARGWELRCDYPGSYWLWSRTILPSGNDRVKWRSGTFIMNKKSAISVQRAIDQCLESIPYLDPGEEEIMPKEIEE